MKKLLIASIALLLLISSCDDGFGLFDKSKSIKGKGAVEKQDRDAKDFKGINLMGSGDVFVKQGTAYKVVVEGQKNILDILETVVKNGILEIKFKKGSWNINYDKLNIFIETPSVSSIELSGSGNMTIESALNTNDLTIKVSGAGDIKAADGVTTKKLNVEIGGSGNIMIGTTSATELSADILGSGNFSIKGTGEKAELTVTGSGNIEANEFVTKSIEAQTTGSGDINCHATESIDASVTGSGNISYAGNAPSVKSKVTGSGEIQKK
jgi:hypothetical protein